MTRSAGFTTSMIGVCWIVFVLDWVSPHRNGFGTVELWGALIPAAVLHGEYWRLVTYGFVHANLGHILVNSYALFQVGDFVEYVYGTSRYALIYLVALLGGGFAAYITTAGTGTITVGASGAIMGVFGAMAVLAFKLPPLRPQLLRAAGIPIILTLGYGLVVPGISNAGHIGGLISGAIVASLIKPTNASAMIRQLAAARV